MKNRVLLSMLVLFILSCKEEEKVASISEDYKTELEAYRADKNQSRKDGYLKLAGLFKFTDTITTFGNKSSASFNLSIDVLPELLGTFTKKNGNYLFDTNLDIAFSEKKDSIIKSIDLTIDENGNSRQLSYDRLSWQIITRSGSQYLRVWDSKNPAIDAFKGFKHYPISSNLILDANFEFYDSAKEASVKSQLGVNANTKFIGKVTFNFNGETHDLEVGQNGFLMVADETTGDATYGGGRYVYLYLPKQDGKVTIDFNKLYNPPCSFSEFTTCLYPPSGNYLPIAIEAGEKIALKAVE